MIRRILLSVILIAVISSLMLVVVSVLSVRTGLESIDHDRMDESVRVVKTIISDEIRSLCRQTEDWANWDDTVAFVESECRDEGFIEDNIYKQSLDSIGASAIAFYGQDGQLLYSRKNTDDGVVEPTILKEGLCSDLFLATIGKGLKNETRGGLFRENERLWFVAASSIYPSSRTGDPRGTLVLFRGSNDAIKRVMEIFPAFSIGEQEQKSQDDQTICLSGKQVWGEFWLSGFQLGTVYQASLEIKSVSGRQGVALLWCFIGSSLLLVTIVCGSLWSVMNRVVLGPLGHIIGEVRSIGMSADTSRRLTDRGFKSEFGHFIGDINIMLDSFQRAEAKSKSADDALRRSERITLLGKFAGGIAHDMNNQLAIIKGYADSLKFSGSLEEALGLSESISRTVDECSSLIGKILSFSRKGNINFEDVDLNVLTADVSAMLQYTMGKNSISLESSIGASSPNVRGNKSELQNAILNLLVNAREALGDQGHIIISTRNAINPDGLPSGSYVAIEVHDDGPGVPQSILDNLFVPFHTTKEHGTGIGLSMVQGTALRHNGSVKLKTKEGDTSFIVMIPVVQEQKMVTSKLRMEKKAGRRKILHVDDEMAILEIFKMHFEQHGYDSESFPEGSGAIEYFKTHSNEFDAVLLDVAVPPSGGEQIFDEVKKIRPSIPVAFVTGYYESKADDLREKGAFAVFEKPVNFKAVFQELDCIIEQTRS